MSERTENYCYDCKYALAQIQKLKRRVGSIEDGCQTGMTLRDYFAGQALIGIYSNPMVDNGKPDGYARSAYRIADAMLLARQEVSDA